MDVADLVRTPRASRRLFGYQGLPPVDIPAIEDLLLRFSVPELAKALGRVSNKQVMVVRLTGRLEDGTPIKGEDVVVITK